MPGVNLLGGRHVIAVAEVKLMQLLWLQADVFSGVPLGASPH